MAPTAVESSNHVETGAFLRAGSDETMRDVISSFRGSLCALVLAAGCAAPRGRANGWQRQYQYDEEKSALTIGDMQFPSASRGVAVGTIHNAQGIAGARRRSF